MTSCEQAQRLADLRQAVGLGWQEAVILLSLLDQRGRVVVYDALCTKASLDAADPLTTATLASAVKRVRQKLKTRDIPVSVKCLRSSGYYLINPTRWTWETNDGD